MKNPIQISWLDLPESQDYPAALSYLSLISPVQIARQYVDRLQIVEISHFKAKDIFRSSRLGLLGVSNSHIVKDQKKIKKGFSLSPLLLVRDPKALGVIIADGYHRLCAVLL